MILTLLLYRYLHNLCLSLTFILSHLRYLMMSLSPIRFCYQVFILNNPTFVFSFQCKSCQILLLHSATITQFPHQTRSKQRTVFESWCSGLVILRGPLCSRHPFSSTFSSSYSFAKCDFFIFSGFCVCKSQCLLISLCKIQTNLPAQPSSWKKIHMPLPRDWQALRSQAFVASVLWTLFSFNDIQCSKTLCRSGGFKGWSLVLSLSWKFCVRFCKLLWLLLCQIYLGGRSLKQGYL